MKRQRKKFQAPFRPWDKERIELEKELLKNFGLKNKMEIWKIQAMLRKYRRLARELVAKGNKDKEKILIDKLINLGILSKGATLDDVLSLTIEDFLNRRLQTVVYKKNFVNTPKQARQAIVHGHVYIDNRKVKFPSYMIPVDEEDKIIIKNIQIQRKITSVGESNGETRE